MLRVFIEISKIKQAIFEINKIFKLTKTEIFSYYVKNGLMVSPFLYLIFKIL